MNDVMQMFPFNGIKTNQSVGSTVTGAVYFPKMYFCNKTLTSGTYKGKFAYFVSGHDGNGYHLAPTFYNGGRETAKGVYIARYENFLNGNTSGWVKCNIYDYFFLVRLYLITGNEFGLLSKSLPSSWPLGAEKTQGNFNGNYLYQSKIGIGNETFSATHWYLLDDKRYGQFVANGHSYFQTDCYPITFRTDKVGGCDFGDIFVAGSLTKNINSGLCRQYTKAFKADQPAPAYAYIKKFLPYDLFSFEVNRDKDRPIKEYRYIKFV